MHAWIPCLLTVIINTPHETTPSNSYEKYQHINDEKMAESDKIKNDELKTIHNTSSSDQQSDYNSNDIDETSSRSSDNQSESYSARDSSSSGHQTDYDSNEDVKDADLTVFINLDDSYEDDADNETITSKPNDTIFENSESNNIFNETSQPAESTRSEISYQKYQVTYVPVKYYPTAPTVPVPTKTFDLSINSETSVNKLFLSRFQLQFSRAPPADKVINNNNNNGNINYYNSYFGNNHFKVPSLLKIPSIVANRIKKKGAAFFEGLAGFYNA